MIEKRLKNHNEILKNVENAQKIILSEEFPYSMLSYHTEGFSIGSMKKVIEKVMIPERIQWMEMNPLDIKELIEPLSEEEYVSQEQYE